MTEIDVTDPKLDWNAYTADELVNAKLVTPRPEGANWAGSEMDLRVQAERDLRDHLSPEDKTRRIRAQRDRAQDTLNAAHRTLNSMGNIQANLNVLEGLKPVPLNLKPQVNIDMDKLYKSLTNQMSRQLHVKVSPEGTLTTTPTNDDEEPPATPELTETEEELLREAQTISGSEALDSILTYVEDVSTTLTDQTTAGAQQAKFNRRWTIISIIVASLSLALAITTACITLFGPTPTVELPTNPIPVEVIEPTNK